MILPVGKAVLVLAASDLRERDMHKLALWIERNGADAFVERIVELRAVADGDSRQNLLPIRPASPRQHEGRLGEEVLAKIERLLFDEARLTRSEASNLIKSRLERTFGQEVPELQRVSFRSWLKRVSDFVPESELLHLVTNIRNQRVHSDPSAWPLISSKKNDD